MRKETVRRGTDQDPHNVTGTTVPNGVMLEMVDFWQTRTKIRFIDVFINPPKTHDAIAVFLYRLALQLLSTLLCLFCTHLASVPKHRDGPRTGPLQNNLCFWMSKRTAFEVHWRSSFVSFPACNGGGFSSFVLPDSAGGGSRVCPIPPLSDLLCVSPHKANQFLVAAGLLQPGKFDKSTLSVAKIGWDRFKSEYKLDIELDQASDVNFLGLRVVVVRVGVARSNVERITAKTQAKRFFVDDEDFKSPWIPPRTRVVSEANRFVAKASHSLTLFLVEQQEEELLDDDSSDGSDDSDDYDDSSIQAGSKVPGMMVRDDTVILCSGDATTTGSSPPGEAATIPLATPSPAAKKRRIIDYNVKFDQRDASKHPIEWKALNGVLQMAVRVPISGTRDSFRKAVKVTGWVGQIINNMHGGQPVPKEDGIGWFLESINELNPAAFQTYCKSKGFVAPGMAQMNPERSAAMWNDCNATYATQRTINKHCTHYFGRRVFAKESDVRGFGETAMEPLWSVCKTSEGKSVFFWWKPPDRLLENEINDLLDKADCEKLTQVDFSTGGDHGKGRFRQLLTMVFRFGPGAKPAIHRFIVGEIDSGKDSTEILQSTFFKELNDCLKKLASGCFVVTRDKEAAGCYSVAFSSTGLAPEDVVVAVDSRMFVCGDAKFYMQVLGREHASPHWCVWCDINLRNFDLGIEHYPGNLILLDIGIDGEPSTAQIDSGSWPCSLH